MNATDIVVIVVILLSGLFALIRGFVREMLGVAGWVGAAFATLYLFHSVTPWFQRFIAIPWLANVAAGVALFIVSLIVLSVISHAIALRVHQSNFSALDKSLGLVFGLLRGAVVMSAIYLALDQWAFSAADYPPWIKEARTRPLVERGARLIEQLIPENARRRSSQAVSEAEAKAREGLEAKRAVDQLLHPAPKAEDHKEREGYTAEQRKAIDRAFQTNQ